MTVAPCRPTTLSPADRLACSMALATPSVTNVKTAGYGSVGLLWVTTKQGMSPSGPPSPQPPSPSFLLNDLRPITTAPQPSIISCSMARSSSVAAVNIQSCSIPAPSPNGFSRLSFGPVTYPSSDIDISQITSAMDRFLSSCLCECVEHAIVVFDRGSKVLCDARQLDPGRRSSRIPRWSALDR